MTGVRAALLELPYPLKRLMAITLDISLGAISVPVALYLRLGELPQPGMSFAIAVVMAVTMPPALFAATGTYRVVFRYVGWSALMSLARALLAYSVMFAGVFTLIGLDGVPRTVGLIQPITLFLLVGGARGFVSMWLGGEHIAKTVQCAQRVLIYGAGQAGRQLFAGLAKSRQHEVLGFLDDSPSLIGRTLFGKKIFDPAELATVQYRLDVTDLLIALPSVGRSRRTTIIESVRRLPIHVRTLPGIAELATGKLSVGDLRELQIDDLLGRETVPPDNLLLARNVHDKIVLVTGAGGSIGSELCRQALAASARRLVLVDQSEFALYQIHQELSERIARSHQNTQISAVLASVCDPVRMDEVLACWRPDTIYHAAAYKHVPLVEDNPLEAIRNNVFGTITTAQAAIRHKVEAFILISTDKAVRPTNVMGATKRLAEHSLQALAVGCATRLTMVRFGNVLGSSGSVVPLFRRQINEGGPVTITHPDVIRYFMTIPEAAQLVIQAGALAAGGELFVLDMGSPVKIYDLAQNMIELSGLTVKSADDPEGDIEIRCIGLRPGEKLYEELLIGCEPAATIHPRIMSAREYHLDWPTLDARLELLRNAIERYDHNAAIDSMRALVPEYAPASGNTARQFGQLASI